MMNKMPVYPEDITPAVLNELANELHPGTTITGVDVTDARGFGEIEVSTSSRVRLDIRYGDNPHGLPEKAVAKMLKTDDWPSHNIQTAEGARQRIPRLAIYENEVKLYLSLGKELPVAAPVPLGARFDAAENRFILVLGDLGLQDAYFPNQLDDLTEKQIFTMVDTLARLHAAYWGSPRFNTDLSWLQLPGEGPVIDCMNGPVKDSVINEVAKHKVKRELLGCIGTTPDELFHHMAILHKHQARLPPTVVHGDMHMGNTYRLPDDSVGFFDWQLVHRGFGMRDVAYCIVNMLSIEQRRRLERDLVRYYGEQLQAYGVALPENQDFLWTEYRRAVLWTVSIGFTPCPEEAYGWEIMVLSNMREIIAYEDLETRKAMKELAATVG